MDKFMDNKMIDDKYLEQVNGGQIEPPTNDDENEFAPRARRRNRCNNTSNDGNKTASI